MNGFLPISAIVVIVGCIMAPFLVLLAYRQSGASMVKSVAISAAVAVWGSIMYMIVTSWQFSPLVPGGALGVSVFLALHLMWPSVLIAWKRPFFVGEGLNIKWLLVPHLFRLVGILFLLEAFNGQLGTVFSFVSGLGDVMAAVIAATLLIVLLTGGRPGRPAQMFLIVFGVTDFFIAFSLGALSAQTPIQLLAFGEVHRVTHFPIGMIPFFLVPLAMAFHWLMYFSLSAQDSKAET